MRLLDRYMARELIWPFLAGVAAFTAILMGTNLLFQLAKMAANGVPLSAVLRLFLLGLPSFTVLTFPMAMLFSSLMAFGRLSGESEMVAMFASGINLYRMLVPVVLVSVGVAVITWEFNEAVVPWSSRSAAELQKAVGQIGPQQRIILPVYQDNRIELLVMAGEFDRSKSLMKDVIFERFDRGKMVLYVNAPEARYSGGHRWEFYRCTAMLIQPDGPRFGTYPHVTYDIANSPDDVQKSGIKSEQMTYGQLESVIREKHRQGLTGAAVAGDEVDLQRKLALPFTSLVFAAIGAPLGIRPSRRASGYGLGLGFSILIIFAFYVLTSYLSAIGGLGVLDPVLAAWLPNVITLAIGGILLVRAPR